MNIANSRALLLSLLVCLFALSLSATHLTDGKVKETKKEIIVVSIDQNIGDQLSGLAQYTYDLYLSSDKGLVSITKYLDETMDEDKTVETLISLLKDLGVSETNINVSSEKLTLAQPYFTLSVSAIPAVQ
jgi:hypothetical protein